VSPVKGMRELVATHPLLAGLPAPVLADLSGCARNVTFRGGGLVLAEGEPADTFYLLRRGRVAIEVGAPGKGALVVETLGPGASIGWSWLIPPYRWQFDVRALDDVGAIALDAACLRGRAEADPVLGYELLKRVSGVLLQRLQATRVRLLDLYGTGVAT
jgi:CRP/FNR family transcriptional regulator, cyclic AMP receptor protein